MRISNAAAQQKELCFRRSQRKDQLVIGSTYWVRQQLIFINYQQSWTFPAQKPGFLGLERRDHYFGIEIFGQIASGNANIPSTLSPLG